MLILDPTSVKILGYMLHLNYIFKAPAPQNPERKKRLNIKGESWLRNGLGSWVSVLGSLVGQKGQPLPPTPSWLKRVSTLGGRNLRSKSQRNWPFVAYFSLENWKHISKIHWKISMLSGSLSGLVQTTGKNRLFKLSNKISWREKFWVWPEKPHDHPPFLSPISTQDWTIFYPSNSFLFPFDFFWLFYACLTSWLLI